MNKKFFVCVGILTSFVLAAYAGAPSEVEKVIAKARKKEGKVIYASPKGGNGTLNLTEAIKELKSGCILRLAPGKYQDNAKKTWLHRIDIEPDNVIVEGDGSGRPCELTVVFWGQNCIARNLWISSIEGEGVTIVDCRTNPVINSSGTHSKSYIYNCLLHYLWLYANNTQVYVENSTLVRMFTPPRTATAQWKVSGGGAHRVGGYGGCIMLGQFARKGEVNFKKCIFYSNGFLFYSRWGIASLSMKFDGCAVYSGQGMFQGNKDAKRLKDIKQACRVRFGEKNYEGESEIQLAKKPEPRWHGWWTGYPGSYYMPIAGTPAAENGMGCYIGGNNLPSPRPEGYKGAESVDKGKGSKKKTKKKGK